MAPVASRLRIMAKDALPPGEIAPVDRPTMGDSPPLGRGMVFGGRRTPGHRHGQGPLPFQLRLLHLLARKKTAKYRQGADCRPRARGKVPLPLLRAPTFPPPRQGKTARRASLDPKKSRFISYPSGFPENHFSTSARPSRSCTPPTSQPTLWCFRTSGRLALQIAQMVAR